MVSQTQSSRLSLAEASQLREQVGGLLNRLIADRDMSEKRQAEAGKRDPMKFVTGRTALDNAIDATREMMGRMDMLLGEMHDGFDDANVNAVKPSVRPSVRPSVPPAPKPVISTQFRFPVASSV
jgi:hypothetical protein